MPKTPKFWIYKDEKGEWRWTLLARNGRCVGDSGEGYRTKSGAMMAARSVVRVAKAALVAVEEPE